MVQLFLTEPFETENGDADAFRDKLDLLKKLESALWSLITSGSRSEARMWLCNTISCINPISPRHQRQLFMKLLSSRPPKRALASQLIQVIFEKRPHKAADIIAKKSYILEKFFQGNSKRILQFFDVFSTGGEFEHGKGSRALSQFAFVNRDICWEELEWKGKHGQSPAMVATKPHYFLDLDVQRTVENFLENVPEFWSSNELAESLKGGEIFLIDTKFFVDHFVSLMYEEDSKEVWEVINVFLEEETFSDLCHHFLIILDEQDLFAFLNMICGLLPSRMDPKDLVHPSCWLEIILSSCNGRASIDELLLLNAIISQGRQLLRLIRDEDDEEQKGKIKDLVFEISTSLGMTNFWAPLMEEQLSMKTKEMIKWLGLISWVLHYRLSEECETTKSWETLFIQNGISFRKSEKYALLHPEGFSDESGSELGERGSVRSRRKKKAKSRKKKRRRSYDHVGSSDSELVDLDSSLGWRSLQSGAGSWFLSTDDYSSAWSSVVALFQGFGVIRRRTGAKRRI
ncbi:PREDICTED: uncharacterized protein LOC104586985 isoform X2 [Nelumbo nucifera]|uniref:Uncharacterized protein n=2 Tax=Nelumbo nucifera TaxID=4432 RepID=A0A822XXW7_NELNU|nr:PREDICTED: uncharacterized protein LOC104586985 isoform X2 [Nelumbo nucifera]DAD25200.1 TPA_asm: hypothetical protein HUJ06_026664 [Nelumbo nucifera]